MARVLMVQKWGGRGASEVRVHPKKPLLAKCLSWSGEGVDTGGQQGPRRTAALGGACRREEGPGRGRGRAGSPEDSVNVGDELG